MSVHPSDRPVPGRNSRTELPRKPKIGRIWKPITRVTRVGLPICRISDLGIRALHGPGGPAARPDRAGL